MKRFLIETQKLNFSGVQIHAYYRLASGYTETYATTNSVWYLLNTNTCLLIVIAVWTFIRKAANKMIQIQEISPQ